MKVTDKTKVWVVLQEGYYETEVVAVCFTEERANKVESMSEGRWTKVHELDMSQSS